MSLPNPSPTKYPLLENIITTQSKRQTNKAYSSRAIASSDSVASLIKIITHDPIYPHPHIKGTVAV